MNKDNIKLYKVVCCKKDGSDEVVLASITSESKANEVIKVIGKRLYDGYEIRKVEL